ncbi:hypothetical protein [Evansella tamaricis]|uniref:DUF998 domain-containing protein n=1 Tax=Evansella tamaricis TaxID=2069301 RepID=A0ABS6JBZ7_9BACI|nr:hypothetical protein [Evansella tamaricis]MBU9711186.1 hypothetical protein [Evansella tamaricis]
MPVTMMKNSNYLSVFSLVIAGILFVIYPSLRPYSDEITMEGAIAFASTEWLISHILAIIAFTLLPLGLLGVHHSLQGKMAHKLSYWAFILSLVALGLILPFYGGETFGLHAIGQKAIEQQSIGLLSQADIVRSGVGLVMFLTGLLLLAIAAIIVAIAIWKSSNYSKWIGIPFAIGMILYSGQFLVGPQLRIAHGLLVTISCILIAISLWKNRNQSPEQLESYTF